MQINKLEDKGWEAMNELLNQEMPQKKKRKAFFIWWFWGAISFIGLLVAGTFLYLNKDGQAQQSIQSKEHVASSLEKDPVSQSVKSNSDTKNNFEDSHTSIAQSSSLDQNVESKSMEKEVVKTASPSKYNKITKKENLSFALNLNQNSSSDVFNVDLDRREELNNEKRNDIKKETIKDISRVNNSTETSSPSLLVNHDRVEQSISMLELPANLNSLKYELKEKNTSYSLSATENKKWLLNSEINLMSSYSSAVKSVGFGMESLISVKHVNTSWILLSGIGFHRFNAINLEEDDFELKDDTSTANGYTADNTISSRDYLMIPLMVAYERRRFRLATGIRYGVLLESPKSIGGKHVVFLTSQFNYRITKRFSVFTGYDYEIYKTKNVNVLSPTENRVNNPIELHSIKAGISFRF